MIDRYEALNLIKHYLKNKNLIRNSFAAEAILKEVAKRLKKDELLWSLTGLLYNIDFEYTSGELDKRGFLSSELLNGLLPENAINAIMSNNYIHTGILPTSSLDKAVISSDAAINLIYNATNIIPSKKIQDIDINFILNEFNDNNFAEHIDRNRIKLCVDFGMDIKNFLDMSLNILKKLNEKFNI